MILDKQVLNVILSIRLFILAMKIQPISVCFMDRPENKPDPLIEKLPIQSENVKISPHCIDSKQR